MALPPDTQLAIVALVFMRQIPDYRSAVCLPLWRQYWDFGVSGPSYRLQCPSSWSNAYGLHNLSIEQIGTPRSSWLRVKLMWWDRMNSFCCVSRCTVYICMVLVRVAFCEWRGFQPCVKDSPACFHLSYDSPDWTSHSEPCISLCLVGLFMLFWA